MILANYLNSGLGVRNRIYTVNLEITGLCNSYCSYCHFYLKHDRKTVAYHMPIEQFRNYCYFIRYWSANSGGETNYRFSGGDPITLKDDLFKRAALAYEITQLRPFLLTHGSNLKPDWFYKAKDSAFEAIYVSVENPVSPDLGAQDPRKTIDYVLKYSSASLPIKLGVCLIPNEQFVNLLKICDWFYESVGYIPPIAEVNYAAYQSPTEKQWRELELSLMAVLEKYLGKTSLNLFHSVSPELAYGGADPYVFSLGLINRFHITDENIDENALAVADDIKTSNYPFLGCTQDCPWSDFCINTKWYWQGDSNTNKTQKISDYCKFKRILNDSYFRVTVDPSYKNTSCAIFNT